MSLDDLAEMIGGVILLVIMALVGWIVLAIVLPWLAHPVVALIVWSWRHGLGSW